MDWVSRAVLAWRLSNTLGAEFCVEALEEALSHYGRPEIFNTDQGSQFTSDDFTGTLERHKVTISMDGKGRQREREIELLQTELVHIDAVLRMFRPEFKAEALPVRHRRPIKSPYFRHGELTQRIYDALRQRGMISSADVAVQAMRDKGLDPATDPVTRTDFVRRVGLQLNALRLTLSA
jgi:transposase InsO family protein